MLGGSQDSAVCIAIGYRLGEGEVGVPSPVRVKNFLHIVHKGIGDHTAFYWMGIKGSLTGGKAAGAWS
jgi:hypothetical protein